MQLSALFCEICGNILHIKKDERAPVLFLALQVSQRSTLSLRTATPVLL
jgi:hypothetical protein